MYYLCKGCDDCCSGCCKCCEDCCGDCCDALSQCFSTPFSFCTFMTFFVSAVPFILMIIAEVKDQNLNCQQNLKLYLAIQGVNNLLNFLFCIYLMCRYQNGSTIATENKSFLEKTKDLILYDWGVCLYIFLLIFFFIWMIIGFSQVSQEPNWSECQGSFLKAILQVNLWTMLVYLIIGFFMFIITVIIQSCDEGSCSCGSLLGCCCTIMTCGLCNLSSNKRDQNYYNSRKNQYQESRKGWINSGKRIMAVFLGRPQQNENIRQMNNVYMAPVQQQQQQPQSNSIWDYFDCFKSNNQHHQVQTQQAYPQQMQQPQFQPIYQQPVYQQPVQQQIPIQQQYYQPPQYQQQQPYLQQQPQNYWGK